MQVELFIHSTNKKALNVKFRTERLDHNKLVIMICYYKLKEIPSLARGLLNTNVKAARNQSGKSDIETEDSCLFVFLLYIHTVISKAKEI